MLMVDLEQGKVLDDEKVKRAVYEGKSYYNWIIQNRLKLRLEPEHEWLESSFDEKTLSTASKCLWLYIGRCKNAHPSHGGKRL